MKKVAVIGIGYVGLPVALLAQRQGFDVIGIEVNPEKLKGLQQGSAIADIAGSGSGQKTSGIVFTDDFAALTSVDVALVCVPTPINERGHPDLTHVESASLGASKYLQDGCLLILESTVSPGTCDEVLIPLIEKHTQHVVGTTLYVAHCPERVNTGDPKWHVGNINRVLGADSKAGLEMAYEFYRQLIDAPIKRMDNLKEAEAVKLVENSFRDINIAFVNELAMSFDTLGININNVIKGASTKPFAFMAHWPGIGVGGHCIPVDPYYLIDYARDRGFDHKFLSLARSINDSMPEYAVSKVEQALLERTNQTLKNVDVAVLGISYKANVADDRESPAYEVIAALQARGAFVTAFDPRIPEKSDVNTLGEALARKQAVIVTVDHDEFTKLSVSDLGSAAVLLDGKNVLKHLADELEGRGVAYLGIGARY